MNVKYEKKPEMTFIGYHTEIRPEEGYQKCPEFWDREFAAKIGNNPAARGRLENAGSV